jgi:hypothetical protein
MFTTIPPQRLLLYILIAGVVPVLVAWFLLSTDLHRVESLQARIQGLTEQAYIKERKQASNISIRAYYRDADHFYIDKNLETLTFLEPEIESMKRLLDNPNYPDDDLIKKRIEHLTGPANSMILTEGVVQSTPLFQEVVETLVHPVEINAQDLQTILCRIEGLSLGNCTPPPNRPQLIITDFKLEKKIVSENNEVYQLNLKILKREFL